MNSIRLLALAGLVALASTGFAEEKAAKPKLDADGNGEISKEEMAAAPEKMKEKLTEADKDHSGDLSKEEYEAYKAAAKKK